MPNIPLVTVVKAMTIDGSPHWLLAIHKTLLVVKMTDRTSLMFIFVSVIGGAFLRFPNRKLK